MKLKKQTLLIIVIGILISSGVKSQKFARKLSIGVKAGINFTIANSIESFSVLGNSTSNDEYIKDYEPLNKNLGTQFGLVIHYSLSERLYLSFQPLLFNYNFEYVNEYAWSGNQYYRLHLYFRQNLEYVELPLYVKWEIGKRRIQPYIQGGFYYSLLHKATKYVERTESSIFGDFEYENESLGSDNSYLMSNIGAIAGLGVTYSFKRSKIGLETNFRYGFNNLARKETRAQNNTLTGKSYDIPDDIKLMNLSINIVYSIALKCIEKDPLPRFENQ